MGLDLTVAMKFINALWLCLHLTTTRPVLVPCQARLPPSPLLLDSGRRLFTQNLLIECIMAFQSDSTALCQLRRLRVLV